MATLRDVAREAGVSIDTASRVLNGRNKETWASTAARAERVRHAAERLGYTPHYAARSMRSRRTHLVGAILRNAPDAPLHYLESYEWLLGATARLEEAGYLLTLIRCSAADADHPVSRIFQERMLDGLLFGDTLPIPLLERLQEMRLPAVHVDTDTWRATGCVRRDEIHTGRTLGRAILNAGCRDVLWLTLPEFPGRPLAFPQRLEGFKDALAGSGVRWSTLEVRATTDFLPQDAERLRPRLKPGVAIAVATAGLAQWVREVALREGLRAGVEFGLGCCDDSQSIRLAWPELSRVAFDRYAMGCAAAELLVRRLERPTARPASLQIQGDWIAGQTLTVSTEKHRP